MPIFERINYIGPYFQYGYSGKKYYYLMGNVKSKNIAYLKALRQTKAIHAKNIRRY